MLRDHRIMKCNDMELDESVGVPCCLQSMLYGAFNFNSF